MEKRNEQRVVIELRADGSPLSEEQFQGIMDGEGYSDLFMPSYGHRQPREGMHEFKASDLSRSGVRLRASFELKEGQRLAVDLHLPTGRLVVKTLVDVRWSVPDGADGWVAGARFSAMELDGGRRITELIDENLQ